MLEGQDVVVGKEEQNLLWEAQKTAQEITEQILELLRERESEKPALKDTVSDSKIQQMIEYEKDTVINLGKIRSEVRKLGK